MKKLISITIVLFFSFSLVLGIEIESCRSGGQDDWYCEDDEICICEISGDCNDGRLLVYETDIRNLLCAPKVVDDKVDISWVVCDNPRDWVKVRLDCEEGQSSEEIINILNPPNDLTTTTIVTTTIRTCNYVCQSTCTDDNNPPFCYKKISHGTQGCPSGTICCEEILKDCPDDSPGETTTILRACPYECCIDMPGYKYKGCPSGLTCQNHLCKEPEREPNLPNIPKNLIFWVILASIIPILAFLIFIWGGGDHNKIPEY